MTSPRFFCCDEAVLFALGLFWAGSPSEKIAQRLVIFLAALVVTLIAPCGAVIYYYKYHLQLDTGAGG